MSEIDYKKHCRVCGLDQGEPIWGEDGQCPTYIICECCGVEFGYGDHNADNCRAIRKDWLEVEGGKWWRPKSRPADWSWEEQRQTIPPEFRD
jgi:hypothetical protein